MNIYYVGGTVRDQLLNLKPKDVDLACEVDSFEEMKKYVLKNSSKIFLEKPEFGTIRYLNLKGEPQDISLCIKSRSVDSGSYQIGSIAEDLANRDFTINAIARNIETSVLHDPLGGQNDLKTKTIKCCNSPAKTFGDDPVRIIRALRFKLQFGFSFDHSIAQYFTNSSSFDDLKLPHSERVRAELDKCFKISPIGVFLEVEKINHAFLRVLFSNHGLKVGISL
ncbi:MAG: CCA tRNA nucleotidyltransferase [Bacteriovoracaceae bacterium]|jgi:tRNA nucleotidyltransferase/poly(A) polymerase|nr:CCA tRNA nucleotidyltransferase [Bacteriovoracaceae bacterium]